MQSIAKNQESPLFLLPIYLAHIDEHNYVNEKKLIMGAVKIKFVILLSSIGLKSICESFV